MFNKAKEIVGAVLVAALGLVYLLFRIEAGKRQQAETKLANAEVDKKDLEIEVKEKEVEKQIAETKLEGEKEKNKELSTEEMENALNKL